MSIEHFNIVLQCSATGVCPPQNTASCSESCRQPVLPRHSNLAFLKAGHANCADDQNGHLSSAGIRQEEVGRKT